MSTSVWGLATALALVFILCSTGIKAETMMPGYERSQWFGEQVREIRMDTGVRMIVDAPEVMHADRPTLVVFYATPNGNTIEQTLGCAITPDLDWHFDIQHIAAQTRRLRQIDTRDNIVLVCMEAQGLSWPSWRRTHADSSSIIRKIVEQTIKEMPGSSVNAVIAGHSGGGSMIFGFLNAGDEIPSYVKRIAFLDADYAYSDKEKHGEKLLGWLRASSENHLVVIAYDDRDIELNGKRVLGPTGGTFRATYRMIERFENDTALARSSSGDIDRYDGMNGQIRFFIHRNPHNKILHTALVGEMNGYLEALTAGTSCESKWGEFGGNRAYTKYVQPAAISVSNIPFRPGRAEAGSSVMKRVAQMPLAEREAIIKAEIEQGNLPEYLRNFITIHVKAVDSKGKEHTAVYQVAPDYLAVGSDKDFVRVPLTPMTAQPIADEFRCILPTRKMVNDIYLQAEVKLDPKPLTEAREAVDTFVQHNAIIEEQRRGKHLGALIAGIKKDVVITNMLADRPEHVAIYGWHKLDGSPIQPLTTVHKNFYVDYSHGIRLVKRAMIVDGQPRDIRDVLSDPLLCVLLSDEGPVSKSSYY